MKQTGLMLLLLSAVLVGSGCVVEPPSDIVVEYEIIAVRYDSPNMEVDYSVRNTGNYDLSDIQLFFEIDADGDFSYQTSGWSTTFSLNTGQTTNRTFYKLPALGDTPSGPYTIERARVTGVGMENPEDED